MSSKLLTIGIFTDTYYPHLNGVTTSVDNLVRELRKKGHRVIIVAPAIEDYKDIDTDVLRIPSIKVLPNAPQVRFPVLIPDKRYKTVYSQQFDIIHAHGNGAFSLLGHRIARIKNIPYVLTFHTLLTEYTHYLLNGMLVTPKLMEAVLRFLAQMCDGVLTPSEKMKKKLLSYSVEKEITVISNIIDTTVYKPSKTHSGILRKRFSLSDEDVILLSVGRLEKEKNFAFLIKAFKKVYQSCDNAHLIIVGNGNEEKALISLSESLNISDRVHFTGRIEASDMPGVYQDGDVFVFASTTEVQGMVFLEAGASGLPFVLTKDTSYKNAVEHGINGYTLPLVEREFVEKLTTLCTDSLLRQKFAKKSKELIDLHFNPQKLADQFVTYYYDALDTYSSRPRQRLLLNSTLLKGVYESMRRVDTFVKKL